MNLRVEIFPPSGDSNMYRVREILIEGDDVEPLKINWSSATREEAQRRLASDAIFVGRREEHMRLYLEADSRT